MLAQDILNTLRNRQLSYYTMKQTHTLKLSTQTERCSKQQAQELLNILSSRLLKYAVGHVEPSPKIPKTPLTRGDRAVNYAVGSVVSGSDASRLVAALIALVLLADLFNAAGSRVGDGRAVAVIGVDTGEEVTVRGGDARDGDVALGHGVAISAGSVQLAKVLDDEVGDGQSAGTVVLQDLFL